MEHGFDSWFQRVPVRVFWSYALGLNIKAGSICGPSYSSLLEGRGSGKWRYRKGPKQGMSFRDYPTTNLLFPCPHARPLTISEWCHHVRTLHQEINSFIWSRTVVWLVHISADQKAGCLSWKWARLYIVFCPPWFTSTSHLLTTCDQLLQLSVLWEHFISHSQLKGPRVRQATTHLSLALGGLSTYRL